MRVFALIVLSIWLTSRACFAAPGQASAQRVDQIEHLPLSALISIIENDKASASDTSSALQVLARRGDAAVSAIPSILHLLHSGPRYDCYVRECLGIDSQGLVLNTLKAMGVAAKPAVGELVILLNTAAGIVPEPDRPDPLTPFYTCYRNHYCAKGIFDTLIAIGPGAVEAVPALIRMIKENAGHTGRDDYREEIFTLLGAIGPGAEPAVAVLVEQVNKADQPGRLVQAAITALSKIAPNNPEVFTFLTRAFIRPRSLRLYNASDIENFEELFGKRASYTVAEIRIMVGEIQASLKTEQSPQFLRSGIMHHICGVFKRYPEFYLETVPALTAIVEAYPSNGGVDGLDIVIEALGSFGENAASAVPALTRHALTSGGSVYREEAVAALQAINTAEARVAIADYHAEKWRSY